MSGIITAEEPSSSRSSRSPLRLSALVINTAAAAKVVMQSANAHPAEIQIHPRWWLCILEMGSVPDDYCAAAGAITTALCNSNPSKGRAARERQCAEENWSLATRERRDAVRQPCENALFSVVHYSSAAAAAAAAPFNGIRDWRSNISAIRGRKEGRNLAASFVPPSTIGRRDESGRPRSSRIASADVALGRRLRRRDQIQIGLPNWGTNRDSLDQQSGAASVG